MTGAPGIQASVSNSGSSTAAVFNSPFRKGGELEIQGPTVQMVRVVRPARTTPSRPGAVIGDILGVSGCLALVLVTFVGLLCPRRLLREGLKVVGAVRED